jgi:hypothetical protein
MVDYIKEDFNETEKKYNWVLNVAGKSSFLRFSRKKCIFGL